MPINGIALHCIGEKHDRGVGVVGGGWEWGGGSGGSEECGCIKYISLPPCMETLYCAK